MACVSKLSLQQLYPPPVTAAAEAFSFKGRVDDGARQQCGIIQMTLASTRILLVSSAFQYQCARRVGKAECEAAFFFALDRAVHRLP
ncbi:hypothetical protein AWC29_02730 [Mycobacterium triplex]|uniref:Uncharacterized protein n=1 Tax=Mycobacterium triplex TaxID=47839 RepID=A0ABX3VYD8_9MYCO|nr:hypothetical protein AWC29_02730 [Mycobacterium triplex]